MYSLKYTSYPWAEEGEEHMIWGGLGSPLQHLRQEEELWVEKGSLRLLQNPIYLSI